MLARFSAAAASCIKNHRQTPFMTPSSFQRFATTASKSSTKNPEVIQKARSMAPRVGFFAGLFGSLIGIGGGVIISPWIVNACKTIPQRLVSGTSLSAVLCTAISSGATFAQNGSVETVPALLIGTAAMLTAPFGARMTTSINCNALRRILGVFLISVAGLVPIKAYLLLNADSGMQAMIDNSTVQPTTQETSSAMINAIKNKNSSGVVVESRHHQHKLDHQSKTHNNNNNNSASADMTSLNASAKLSEYIEKQISIMKSMSPSKIATFLGIGTVTGTITGLLGVGGGIIATPLLLITLSSDQSTVLGTSFAAMIVPSAVAFVKHIQLGNVDGRMALGLAIGSSLGSFAGSSVAINTPPGVLEGCFSLGMLYLGRKTLQSIKKM